MEFLLEAVIVWALLAFSIVSLHHRATKAQFPTPTLSAPLAERPRPVGGHLETGERRGPLTQVRFGEVEFDAWVRADRVIDLRP